jgi:hypothetical protein
MVRGPAHAIITPMSRVFCCRAARRPSVARPPLPSPRRGRASANTASAIGARPGTGARTAHPAAGIVAP